MLPDTLKQFAIELAEASGDFIRPYFANPALVVETKRDSSPVTAADRGAEELMRARIAHRFPGHGIIGEEFGDDRPDAEWVWVLDPIDGTKSFMTACPLFGTLIALLHEGRPVLGIIHQPVLRQLLIGDNTTSMLNGRPVKVRPCAAFEDATLLTSDPLNPAKYQNGPAFDSVARKARIFRTWGDCYGYLLVASGWADIVVDPIMNSWDIAAVVPILRGAGGVISDWQGNSPYPATSIVATNPTLHPKLIAALNPQQVSEVQP